MGVDTRHDGTVGVGVVADTRHDGMVGVGVGVDTRHDGTVGVGVDVDTRYDGTVGVGVGVDTRQEHTIMTRWGWGWGLTHVRSTELIHALSPPVITPPLLIHTVSPDLTPPLTLLNPPLEVDTCMRVCHSPSWLPPCWHLLPVGPPPRLRGRFGQP